MVGWLAVLRQPGRFAGWRGHEERAQRWGPRERWAPNDHRLNVEGDGHHTPHDGHGDGDLCRGTAGTAEPWGATPMARQAPAVMAAELPDVHGTARPAVLATATGSGRCQAREQGQDDHQRAGTPAGSGHSRRSSLQAPRVQGDASPGRYGKWNRVPWRFGRRLPPTRDRRPPTSQVKVTSSRPAPAWGSTGSRSFTSRK